MAMAMRDSDTLSKAAVTTSRGVSTVNKLKADGTTEKVTVVVKYLGENLYQILSGYVKDGDVLVYTNSTDWSSLVNMATGGRRL